jgi:hypothetical protein
MNVTAWNNGTNSKTGGGYGVKLTAEDRDQYFGRQHDSVKLTLENGKAIIVNTKKSSFWDGSCRELVHKEIGKWMFASSIAPWPKGVPPRLQLVPDGIAHFRLLH